MKHIIVTGGAGFIGSNIVDALLQRDYRVTVVDNLDSFYDPELKRKNIEQHLLNPDFCFHQIDITDPMALDASLLPSIIR
jgi:UDP-glucuronate 4-epimerase